jgi:hypothetical protein
MPSAYDLQRTVHEESREVFRPGVAASVKLTERADWKMIDREVFGNGFELGRKLVRSFRAMLYKPNWVSA